MEKTTLYLPPELQAELRAAARRERRPQAEIVRDALAKYLAEKPRPFPRSIGLATEWPRDGVDSSNIKAWIRKNWIKDLEREFSAGRGRGRRAHP